MPHFGWIIENHWVHLKLFIQSKTKIPLIILVKHDIWFSYLWWCIYDNTIRKINNMKIRDMSWETPLYDVLHIAPKLTLICSMSSSDKPSTKWSWMTITQIWLIYGNIQPYLIIDGSVYLILWKLDFPPRGVK